MRRRVCLLAVAAALTLAAGPASAATEIQLWHAMSGANTERIEAIADGFNQAQSDYKVVATFKGSYAEALTAGIAAFRAGNPPAILQVQEVATATFMVAKGAIRPVEEVMKEAGEPFDPKSYVPAVAGYYTAADGRMLSFPFNSSTPVLYYNKDLFEEGRARSRQAAEDLGGGRRGHEEAARRGRALRLHDDLDLLDPARDHGGWSTARSSRATTTASAASTPGSLIDRPAVPQAHRHAGRLAEDQAVRLWRPRQQVDAEVRQRRVRAVHRVLGRLRQRQDAAPSSTGASHPCPTGPRVVAQPQQHDHRRRLALGHGQEVATRSTRAWPSSSPTCRGPRSRRSGRPRPATCRSRRPPTSYIKKSGFYEQEPGRRRRRRGSSTRSRRRRSKGVRFGNFVQIRDHHRRGAGEGLGRAGDRGASARAAAKRARRRRAARSSRQANRASGATWMEKRVVFRAALAALSPARAAARGHDRLLPLAGGAGGRDSRSQRRTRSASRPSSSGLANFRALFADPDYLDSFEVTAVFCVAVAVLSLAAALLLAAMADRVRPRRSGLHARC